MKTEKSFEILVRNTLPHASRESFMRDMKENTAATRLQKTREFLRYIVVAYRDQTIQAFNRYSFIGVFLLVVFCFGFSAMPRGYAAMLMAVLGGLCLRDGYLHNRKLKDGVSSNVQYCNQSIGDAGVAGLFAFVSGAVLRGVSPSSAFAFPLLWHGAVTLMGTVFTLKLMLRVKPDPDAPLINKDDNPKAIYRRVRWLSFLWFITFDGIVACGVTDIPHYWPDKLRGFAPLFFFLTWWTFRHEQRQRLRKHLIARMVDALAKRLSRKKFLWGQGAIEVMMYVLIALSVADSILPWMTCSATAAASAVQAAGALLSGSISLITWKYVKEANRVAAEALRQGRCAGL
ncbi:MAG TPA: hypothetical protein VGK48_08170 [Terriglobia bacterium]|jgi:hypothetical protein